MNITDFGKKNFIGYQLVTEKYLCSVIPTLKKSIRLTKAHKKLHKSVEAHVQSTLRSSVYVVKNA